MADAALKSAALKPQSLTKVENNDAALFIAVVGGGSRRGLIHVQRKLEPGAFCFTVSVFILLPTADLVDNKWRKHLRPRFSSGPAKSPSDS